MIEWSLATPFARAVIRAATDESPGVPLFLVGGAVRDLFLGRPFSDVDLLVPSEAEAVAAGLARTLGGQVRSYPEFLTHKVIVEGQPPVDVATARRETYPRPGALPSVMPAPVEDDLGRRDFSINSLALELRTGAVVDPHQGQRDLDRGILRVLHDRSFIDDPTRLLRGLRLAARLKFSFDQRSDELLHDALEHDALHSVSRERVWRELRLAMSVDEPVEALLALADSGSIQRLTGAGRLSGWQRRILPQLDRFLRRHLETDRECALAGVLLHGAPNAEALLEHSGFPTRRLRRILAIASLSDEDVAADLAALQDPGARADRCRDMSGERLAVLAAHGSAAADAADTCLRARGTPLPFSGSDLEVPPGPQIAFALSRTREALAAGSITRDQALAFARRLAMRYLKDHNRSSG